MSAVTGYRERDKTPREIEIDILNNDMAFVASNMAYLYDEQAENLNFDFSGGKGLFHKDGKDLLNEDLAPDSPDKRR